jgi:putative restriction endonuclease
MKANQSLTAFYTDTLGANLTNIRVWSEDFKAAADGEVVQLYNLDWKGKSPGYPERLRHIEAIRRGAAAYGVVCVKANRGSEDTTRIKTFDHETLVRLGEIRQDDRRLYADVLARVPTDTVARRQTAESTLIPDLAALLKKGTTAEALINARVGQGKFRSEVLRLWDWRCSVSGIETSQAIRASHIKPWRDSDDMERLDPTNGLALNGTLDALFDAGLITFAADGALLASQSLPAEERQRLGVTQARLRRVPEGRTAEYLAHHRLQIFVDRPR